MLTKSPHIALLLMMKNEEKRIHVTLESVKDYVKSIVAYDTGSTDNTIQIVKDFCKKTKIKLRLKQGEFVNFSISRNVSLDFADTFNDIDFLLLMDVNDELQNGKKLIEFATNELNTQTVVYLMCQHWWSGSFNKYYNTRFIKSKSGWRYKGSVHEYLSCIDKKKNFKQYKMSDDIILYQDRTLDNNEVWSSI